MLPYYFFEAFTYHACQADRSAVLLPFFNIAGICPSFQSLGMEDVCREFFNIVDSGKLRCSARSDNTLGCILSGPGDLLVFNLFNNVHIVSCVIFNSPIAIVMTLSAILGISPLCSLVKTLEKYSAGMFAFSLSTDVSVEFGSSGSVFRSPFPIYIVSFDLQYFQNGF